LVDGERPKIINDSAEPEGFGVKSQLTLIAEFQVVSAVIGEREYRISYFAAVPELPSSPTDRHTSVIDLAVGNAVRKYVILAGGVVSVIPDKMLMLAKMLITNIPHTFINFCLNI
jgi:hypothetical protein